MKVWKAFSGDHSARLKIVGEFKENKDLRSFENDFIDFTEFVNQKENVTINDLYDKISKERRISFETLGVEDLEAGKYFSKDYLEIISDNQDLIALQSIFYIFLMDEDILVQSLHTYIGISIKRKIYRSCQRLFYLQVYHILALFHFFYFILSSQFVQSLDDQLSLTRVFVIYAVCYLFVIVYF